MPVWSGAPELGLVYYVRQLRNFKTAASLDEMDFRHFVDCVRHCGKALARAHAKVGDAPMISGYLSKGDGFDTAIVRCSGAYVDQTERDFESRKKAAKAGLVPVELA